jgi:hypothetical protein
MTNKQFAMEAMAHRNRWFPELKNGDLWMIPSGYFIHSHGKSPTINGGWIMLGQSSI